MKTTEDIELLLRSAAPFTPAAAPSAVERIHKHIQRSQMTLSRRARLVLVAYGVVAVAVCWVAMSVMAIPIWMIGLSFLGAATTSAVAWRLVKSFV